MRVHGGSLCLAPAALPLPAASEPARAAPLMPHAAVVPLPDGTVELAARRHALRDRFRGGGFRGDFAGRRTRGFAGHQALPDAGPPRGHPGREPLGGRGAQHPPGRVRGWLSHRPTLAVLTGSDRRRSPRRHPLPPARRAALQPGHRDGATRAGRVRGPTFRRSPLRRDRCRARPFPTGPSCRGRTGTRSSCRAGPSAWVRIATTRGRHPSIGSESTASGSTARPSPALNSGPSCGPRAT